MSARTAPNGNGKARHDEAAQYLADVVTPLVAERLGDQVQNLEAQVTRLEGLVVSLLKQLERERDEATGLVGAATLAQELGVDVRWVRTHAIELGGVRLGNGPRPRLRFDVETAKAAMRRRA